MQIDPQLLPLIVLADPELAGRHSFHDHRFIALEGSQFDEDGKRLETGAIVAKLTDCWQQDRYAYAFAVAPELLELARDLVGYLGLKLQGYRQVDKLPENSAIIQTAIRYYCRASNLVTRGEGHNVSAYVQPEETIEQ